MNDEERFHQDETKLPAISYEVWAQVAAELLERTSAERLEILEHRSITPDAWSQAEAHWMAALVEDISSGGSDRVTLYARLCAEEMQARQRPEEPHTPKTEAPASTRTPTETKPIEPTPPPTPVAVAVAAPVVAAPVAAPAEPFVMPMAQQPAYIPTREPITPPPRPVNTTRDMPPLPTSLSGTSLVVDIPRGAALPFAETASSQIARENIEKQAGPAHEPPRGPKELSDTRSLSGMSDIAKQVLPFGTTNPPPSKLQPGDPEFTVERFASLLAELELAPEHTDTTLARYGITQPQRRRLESHWGAKIRAEPQVEAAFHEAKAVYTRWLLSTRR